MHVRYENLKDVVLNELLAEHDHAELDAQLDEASWRRALFEETHIYSGSQRRWGSYREGVRSSYLLHAVVSKNVNIITGAPSKPERADVRVVR